MADMQTRCTFDKLVHIKELKPHPKNRNKHPKDQIDRLAKILEYQGWRYPIKVSNQSGFITSGHGRILAAKQLKWKEVPVNFQDYENEAQEYADVQADNAIASWSELDMSAINGDICDIGPDFDIDLLGIQGFVVEPAELPELSDEDKPPFRQMTFTLSNDQADQVEHAMEVASKMGHFDNTGNENKNGNAIARVCELFTLNNGNG